MPIPPNPNELEFLKLLKMRNIFGSPQIYGNDLPEQGGFTGNMPVPAQLPSITLPKTPSIFENVIQTPRSMNIPPVSPIPERNPIAPHENTPSQQLEDLINWKPQTEATERFENLASSYPNRENYKPGFWRSLGSMIVDYSKGPARGQSFYDEPFNEAQEDWKAKIEPAYQAANLERFGNVNERQVRYQAASQELRDRAQQAREREQEALAKVRQQRADVYQYKTMLPKWQFKEIKGGNIVAFNPNNPLEEVDTGVPSGTLTQMDMAILNRDIQSSLIQERGEVAKEAQERGFANQQETVEKQGWLIQNEEDASGNIRPVWVNPRTQERRPVEGAQGPIMRPGTSSAAETMNPYQERVLINNRARMIRDTMPELAQYLEQDPYDDTRLRPILPAEPSWIDRLRGFKDRKAGTPTQVEYDELVRMLYEGTSLDPAKMKKPTMEVPKPVPSHAPTTPTAPGPAMPQNQGQIRFQRNNVTGEIRMSQDGGKTWVPYTGK